MGRFSCHDISQGWEFTSSLGLTQQETRALHASQFQSLMNLWGVEEQRAQEAKSRPRVWGVQRCLAWHQSLSYSLALFPVPVLSFPTFPTSRLEGKNKQTNKQKTTQQGLPCRLQRQGRKGKVLNGRSYAFYIFLFFCSWQALKKISLPFLSSQGIMCIYEVKINSTLIYCSNASLCSVSLYYWIDYCSATNAITDLRGSLVEIWFYLSSSYTIFLFLLTIQPPTHAPIHPSIQHLLITHNVSDTEKIMENRKDLISVFTEFTYKWGKAGITEITIQRFDYKL